MWIGSSGSLDGSICGVSFPFWTRQVPFSFFLSYPHGASHFPLEKWGILYLIWVGSKVEFPSHIFLDFSLIFYFTAFFGEIFLVFWHICSSSSISFQILSFSTLRLFDLHYFWTKAGFGILCQWGVTSTSNVIRIVSMSLKYVFINFFKHALTINCKILLS